MYVSIIRLANGASRSWQELDHHSGVATVAAGERRFDGIESAVTNEPLLSRILQFSSSMLAMALIRKHSVPNDVAEKETKSYIDAKSADDGEEPLTYLENIDVGRNKLTEIGMDKCDMSRVLMGYRYR